MRQHIAARSVVGFLALVGSTLLVDPARADPGAGALDREFSRDGQAAVSLRSDGAGRQNYYHEDAQDVAVRAGGKIVVAGLYYHGRSARKSGLGVARLKKSGSLDRRFDGDGRAHTRFRRMPGAIRLMFAGKGRVVMAGAARGHVVVARYRSDGSLDRRFSANGKVTTAVSQLGDRTVDTARDTRGRILVAAGAGTRAAIVRYTSDGRRDASFGVNGVVVTDALGGRVDAVALQADSTLIVVTQAPWPDLWRVWRVALDGTVDPGFVSELLPMDFDEDAAHAVTVQDDGRVLVAGHGWFGENSSIVVVRYDTDGSLDETFGDGDGYIRKGQSIWDHAYAMALQPDGKILVAGDSYGDREPRRMRLYRVNRDGTTDRTFSRDGVTGGRTPNPATAVALQKGRIVVIGDAWLPHPAGSALGVVRFLQASR